MIRLLFFFRDGEVDLLLLDEKFFPLAVLLGRLLNEKYKSKSLKFINIKLLTEKTYELHPNSRKYYTHNHGNVIWYNDVFDLNKFTSLNDNSQKQLIWKRTYEILTEAAQISKDKKLLDASQYAYQKGLDLHLNPDYKLVESSLTLYGVPIQASIWVNFLKDGMYSKLTLEKDGKILFEKSIDSTKHGVEFFLEMYKKIESYNNTIIIKGHSGVDYLPLKIPISEEIILPGQVSSE